MSLMSLWRGRCSLSLRCCVIDLNTNRQVEAWRGPQNARWNEEMASSGVIRVYTSGWLKSPKRRRHSKPGCNFQFYCYWEWNVAENLSIYEISHADNSGDCFMQPGLNHNRRVRTLLLLFLLLLISTRLVSGSRTDIWCFQLLFGAAWLVNLSEPLMPTELMEAQLMDCGGLI